MKMEDVKLNDFNGNNFEMGIQQGTVCKQKISNVWAVLEKIGLVETFKPKIVPKSVFLWMAKKRATKTYRELIEKYAPNQAERMRGISQGSGIDLKFLYLLLSMEPLLGKLVEGAQKESAIGCTSIGISPKKSSTGESLIGRNFDILPALIPTYVGRRNNPTDGFSNIDFGLSIFAGNFHGINEKGLTITYDYALPTDRLKPGVPISILIQEALEKYETTEEVVKFFQESPRGNGAILLVGDSSGDMQTIEISCSRIGVRSIEDTGFIVNTNHFLTEEMMPIDFQGKRESTEKRYERANELLSGAGKISEKTLGKVMRDHGPDGNPGKCTICTHGPIVSTTMSAIFNLNKRSMSVAIGNPCKFEYTKFEI